MLQHKSLMHSRNFDVLSAWVILMRSADYKEWYYEYLIATRLLSHEAMALFVAGPWSKVTFSWTNHRACQKEIFRAPSRSSSTQEGDSWISQAVQCESCTWWSWALKAKQSCKQWQWHRKFWTWKTIDWMKSRLQNGQVSSLMSDPSHILSLHEWKQRAERVVWQTPFKSKFLQEQSFQRAGLAGGCLQNSCSLIDFHLQRRRLIQRQYFQLAWLAIDR